LKFERQPFNNNERGVEHHTGRGLGQLLQVVTCKAAGVLKLSWVLKSTEIKHQIYVAVQKIATTTRRHVEDYLQAIVATSSFPKLLFAISRMDFLHTQLYSIQRQLAFVSVDPINWKLYVQAFSWTVALFESYLVCVYSSVFPSLLGN
jgi:hypothetical protein